MTRVVLASASPGRRKVLRQAGIDPLVVVSGVDEEAALAALGTNPVADHATTALAIAKAEAVVGMLDASVSADCVVIGCDSMLHCDGRNRTVVTGKKCGAADLDEISTLAASEACDFLSGAAGGF